MAVNDLITVGATPLVVQAYWAAGGSDWFGDAARAQAAGRRLEARLRRLRRGLGRRRDAGAGRHRREPGASTWRRRAPASINPKERLSLGDRLGAGRRHRAARLERHPRQRPEPGAQAGRAAAAGLPDAGAARAQLTAKRCSRRRCCTRRSPRRCASAGITPHYCANITGHGWRKLLRHPGAFTLPHHTAARRCRRCCSFIQQHAAHDDRRGLRHAQHGRGLRAVRGRRARPQRTVAGRARRASARSSPARCEAGAKQLLIEPLGLRFGDDDLQLR